MSLASWALVLSSHRERANTYAAFVYLLMASFGTLALLLAFGLLAGPQGNYAFDAIGASAHAPAVAALSLALVLLGAGSKAGLVPLHVWLPLAHPAAPSHVSALMSGVMTKVAIYAVIRVAFDLLGPPAWWAGLAVLSLGAVTAVVGILHAVMERDLKRLLAYSSSAWASRWPFKPMPCRPPRRWLSPRRSSTFLITRCSRACSSSAPAPYSRAPGCAISNDWVGSSTGCPTQPLSFSSAAWPLRRCRR
jgi:hypothetical protein